MKKIWKNFYKNEPLRLDFLSLYVRSIKMTDNI